MKTKLCEACGNQTRGINRICDDCYDKLYFDRDREEHTGDRLGIILLIIFVITILIIYLNQ